MFNREEYIINLIKEMNINDKLRLGVAMFSSSFININFNNKEMFKKMDNKLKEIDSTYVMSFSGIYDHAVVMFAMSKIMEFTKEEQNRIALYLINCIKL